MSHIIFIYIKPNPTHIVSALILDCECSTHHHISPTYSPKAHVSDPPHILSSCLSAFISDPIYNLSSESYQCSISA